MIIRLFACNAIRLVTGGKTPNRNSVVETVSDFWEFSALHADGLTSLCWGQPRWPWWRGREACPSGTRTSSAASASPPCPAPRSRPSGRLLEPRAQQAGGEDSRHSWCDWEFLWTVIGFTFRHCWCDWGFLWTIIGFTFKYCWLDWRFLWTMS